MRKTALVLCAAASTALVGAACPTFAAEAVRVAGDTAKHAAGASGDTHGQAPDNTGVNVRDRGGDTLTPMDQAENAGDRTVTQKIRQAIVGDTSLSTTAHNVKVITADGVVTLRGPVRSEQERSAIVAKANQVPGVKRLDDQLDVAGD